METVSEGSGSLTSPVTLPPQVPGPTRGYLEIRFSYLLWDITTPPPSPRFILLLNWWGQTAPGTIFKVPIVLNATDKSTVASSVVKYPICSSWNKLKMYLEDMSHLTLTVGLGRRQEDMFVLGECVIPHLSVLSPNKPFVRTCSVITKDGVHLGRLKVHLKCTYQSFTQSKETSRRETVSSNICHHSKQRDTMSTNQFSHPSPGKLGGKWKRVEPVSNLAKSRRKVDQSKQLQLGNKGKKMIQLLLQQAESLHENMIKEINEGGAISPVAMETTEESPIVHHDMEWVELTPPHSPDSTCSTEMLNEVGLLKLSRKEEERRKIDEEILVLCHQTPVPNTNLKSHDRSCDQNDESCDINKPKTKDMKICEEPQQSFPRKSSVQSLFHMLFQLDEGSTLLLPSNPDVTPNVYVICKLYCMSTPLCTGVYWRDRRPQFNVKQIIPITVQGDMDLSKQHFILEVWHYHRTESNIECNEDELIGLVKINLKPLSDGLCSLYNDPHIIDSIFPMTIADSYCSIISPFTGDTNGYIKLVIVIGTPQQLPSTLRLSKDSSLQYPVQTTTKGDKPQPLIEKQVQQRAKKEKKKHKKEYKEDKPPVENKPPVVTPTISTSTVTKPTIPTKPTINSTVTKSTNIPDVDSDYMEFELTISQALHLPCLSHDKLLPSPPRAYVTCHPHPSVSKITTPISHMTCDPSWDYSCVTRMPLSFLAAAGTSELEFQIWSLPQLTEHDPDVLITEADPRCHVFLGRAYVDIVPIRYGLRTICGWYNISDLTSEIKGQLKVAITPKGQIPFRVNRTSHTNCNVYISSYQTECNKVTNTESVDSKEVIEDTNLSLLRQQLKSHVKELDEIKITLQGRISDTCDKATITTPTAVRESTTQKLLECDQLLKTTKYKLSPSQLVSPSSENPLKIIQQNNLLLHQVSSHVSPSNSPHLSPSHSPHLSPSHSPQESPSHSPHLSPSHHSQVSHSPQESPPHSPHLPPSHHPQVSPSHHLQESPSHSPHLSPQVSPSHYSQESPPHSPQVSLSHSPHLPPSHSPHLPPSHSPQESPPHSPQVSLSHSPHLPPSHSPQESSPHSPQVSLSHSPHLPPSHSPQESPPHSLQVSLSHSPHLPPSHSPQESPPHSPQVSPSHSPHLPPSHSPQESPPQVSPSHSPQVSQKCEVETRPDEHSIIETKQEIDISLNKSSSITKPLVKTSDVILTSSPLQSDQESISQSDNEENTTNSSIVSVTCQKQDNNSDSSTSTYEIHNLTESKELNTTVSDDVEEELEVQRILDLLMKQSVDIASTNDNDQQQHDITTSSSTSSNISSTINVKEKLILEESDEETCTKVEPPVKRRIDLEKLPHFYQPEDELSDRLRQLKLTALSRYPPRPLPIDTPPSNPPMGKPPNVATTPRSNRIYRVFYSKEIID